MKLGKELFFSPEKGGGEGGSEAMAAVLSVYVFICVRMKVCTCPLNQHHNPPHKQRHSSCSPKEKEEGREERGGCVEVF